MATNVIIPGIVTKPPTNHLQEVNMLPGRVTQDSILRPAKEMPLLLFVEAWQRNLASARP